MLRKSLAITVALTIGAGLSACGGGDDQQTATGQAADVSQGQAETPTAQSSTTANVGVDPALTAGAGTPAAGGASTTVPEMAPTGAMAPAVNPNNPEQRIAGAAPQMAPTGNQRAPYNPAAGGGGGGGGQ